MENFTNYGHVETIIICIVAVVIAIFLGNSAVFVFNKLPGQWFLDWDILPGDENSRWKDKESWDVSSWDDHTYELIYPSHQRIKSTPFKYVFSALFIVIGIYSGIHDCQFAICVLAASWLFLLMSLSDIKYMIVPDQLIMLLLVTGIGFLTSDDVPVMVQIKSSLSGLAIGFIALISLAALSKLIFKASAIGGADIKLFSVLGFLTGLKGVIVIFVLSTLISAGHFVILLALKKAKIHDHRPMVPYISASAVVFFILLKDVLADFVISI